MDPSKIHNNQSEIHPRIHLKSIPNSKNPKSILNPSQIPRIHQNPSWIHPNCINQFPVFCGNSPPFLPETSRRRVPKRSARVTSTTRPRQGFRACAKPWPSELRRCRKGMEDGGVRKWRYPKSSKSLDHFRLLKGDLGIPKFLSPDELESFPEIFGFLWKCRVYPMVFVGSSFSPPKKVIWWVYPSTPFSEKLI